MWYCRRLEIFISYHCVQHFTVSSSILCPAHYCVQQNTVSTLTQRVFLSHFNVLRSNHAALAKHLCWPLEWNYLLDKIFCWKVMELVYSDTWVSQDPVQSKIIFRYRYIYKWHIWTSYINWHLLWFSCIEEWTFLFMQ